MVQILFADSKGTPMVGTLTVSVVPGIGGDDRAFGQILIGL